MAFDPTDVITGTGIGATVMGLFFKNLYTRFVKLEEQVVTLKNSHDLIAQKMELNQSHIREQLDSLGDDLRSMRDDFKSIIEKLAK